MRWKLSVVLALSVMGCTTKRAVTPPEVEQQRVWFAEVISGASHDIVGIIVCDAHATPPCVRIAPVDLKDVPEFKEWLASTKEPAAPAERVTAPAAPAAATPSPTPSATPPSSGTAE